VHINITKWKIFSVQINIFLEINDNNSNRELLLLPRRAKIMVTKITPIQAIDLNKREQSRRNDFSKRKSTASFKDTLAAAVKSNGKVNIKI
jgi:hypothetical protein